MNEVGLCKDGNQHYWLPTGGTGMLCYSCPTCGKLVYWSDTFLEWVKPSTSGGRPIIGNNPPIPLEEELKK